MNSLRTVKLSFKNRNLISHSFFQKCYATQHSPSKLEYLVKGDGVKIAYRRYKPPAEHLNEKKPGVIFCPGFQSSMEGVKALSLEKYCIQNDLHYVRFDYQGCGQSTGDLRKALFSDWLGDVTRVLDQLTNGPQIMVGSSMGAWLMILVATERPHRIHSLMGVASAPDFAQRAFSRFSPEVLQVLQDSGGTVIESDYGNYVITKNFLNDIKKYNILHQKSIPILCPVRLLHGMKDNYVSHEVSIKLAQKLSSNDVNIVLRKSGDHRLSRKADIRLLFLELDDLIYGGKEDVTELAEESHTAFSVQTRSEEEVKEFKGE